MQPTALLTSIALLITAIHTPLWAGDHAHGTQRGSPHAQKTRSADGFDHGMQVVVNSAASDAPAYGWRYFSDQAGRRAVVISPQGDYYYSSRGNGLRWVAAEQS